MSGLLTGLTFQWWQLGAAAACFVVAAAMFAVHRVPRLDVRGKTVLVTGGSTGIGFEMARELAKRGALVVICARRADKLAEAAKSINAELGKDVVKDVTMDVTKASNIKAAVAEACRFSASKPNGSGHIDVLICNAGYSFPARFQDLPVEKGTGMMEVNFFGCANVVREVLPDMQQRRSGRVLLVSSMGGICPIAGFTIYSASKAAVRAFAASLDMENAARGVRVQVINPPDVQTEGFEEENKHKSEECKQISQSGGQPWKATDLAKVACDGIRDYSFQINCGHEGFLLGIAAAGMDPPTSTGKMVVETLFGGVVRLIAAIVTKTHYNIVFNVLKKEGVSKY